MDTITALTLRMLVLKTDGPCVSVYMPTNIVGPDAVQDEVRLRHLVNGAEKKLLANGMDKDSSRRFLGPITTLPAQVAWTQRRKGLAIFHSQQMSFKYWVDAPFNESCFIWHNFYIKPLLPLVRSLLHFFVLAISRNQVRLLSANANGFERLKPPHFPVSMKSALNLQGADRGEQVHSAMHGGTGKGAAVFHGQGGHRDTLKEELVIYVRAISDALRPVLRKSSSPLVLAGVEYELALFRKALDYDHICESQLLGAFDHMDDQNLYDAALALALPFSDEPRKRAVNRYMKRADTLLATDDLEEILTAAHQGRLDLLLVRTGQDVYGRFDTEKGVLERVDEPNLDLDLVEVAIEQCVCHGGEVYAVDEALSSTSPMHALVRYW